MIKPPILLGAQKFNTATGEGIVDQMPDDKDKRGKWANKWEFLLSCAGYAIGIANVWRFPYLCYRNGGGAFLIPYLLMLLLCGIPAFFVETSLGQFASTGCLTLFKIAPLFKGVGYAVIVVNAIYISYYNIILSYTLLFLVNCFQTKLPWMDCNNPWNTEHCLKLGGGYFPNESSLARQNETWMNRSITPSDEFFHNRILQISESIDQPGSIVWPLVGCNMVAWAVTFLCIMKGVKTVGKVVYFTATFPFVVLFVLLIRGLTLPGAWDGILFYVWPQWHQLTNLKVWADAAGQIFFSLGAGWGGIVSMASYNDFRNNNKMDSILVPILNCGTSILAGFVVFSVIGFMSHETGFPVSTVATSGPGLAFVTYPEAITMMPWPQFWAILFFVMVFFLGLDTCFVQIEAIISSILDEHPHLRRHKMRITLLVCIVMFAISIMYLTNGGMYLIQLIDWYAAALPVIAICLFEIIIVDWIYGIDQFVRDLEFMIEKKIHWWWILSWKYVAPTILMFILITTVVFDTNITYRGKEYPEWAVILGWCLCGLSIICIPLYMSYRLLYLEKGHFIGRVKSACKSASDWGPTDHEIRQEWLRMVNCETALQSRIKDDPYHAQFIQLTTINSETC